MKSGNLSVLAGVSTLLLLVLAGCNTAKSGDGGATAQKAPPGAGNVATDTRIPEQKREELQRTMAAQQAGFNQMDARMKAAPQPKH